MTGRSQLISKILLYLLKVQNTGPMTESKTLSSLKADKRVNLPSQCRDTLPNLYTIEFL